MTIVVVLELQVGLQGLLVAEGKFGLKVSWQLLRPRA